MKEETFYDKIELRDIFHKKNELIEKLNNTHIKEGNPDKEFIMIHENLEKDLQDSLSLDPRDIVYYYGVYISDEFVGINMLIRNFTQPTKFFSHTSLVDSIDKNPLIVGLIDRKIYELALKLGEKRVY